MNFGAIGSSNSIVFCLCNLNLLWVVPLTGGESKPSSFHFKVRFAFNCLLYHKMQIKRIKTKRIPPVTPRIMGKCDEDPVSAVASTSGIVTNSPPWDHCNLEQRKLVLFPLSVIYRRNTDSKVGQLNNRTNTLYNIKKVLKIIQR